MILFDNILGRIHCQESVGLSGFLSGRISKLPLITFTDLPALCIENFFPFYFLFSVD